MIQPETSRQISGRRLSWKVTVVQNSQILSAVSIFKVGISEQIKRLHTSDSVESPDTILKKRPRSQITMTSSGAPVEVVVKASLEACCPNYTKLLQITPCYYHKLLQITTNHYKLLMRQFASTASPSSVSRMAAHRLAHASAAHQTCNWSVETCSDGWQSNAGPWRFEIKSYFFSMRRRTTKFLLDETLREKTWKGDPQTP